MDQCSLGRRSGSSTAATVYTTMNSSPAVVAIGVRVMGTFFNDCPVVLRAIERRSMKAIPRMNLKDHIRGIPDFPKPGIYFYDISTLLRHAEAWQVAMERMAQLVGEYRPTLLAGIESRGFLIAAPLALKLGCGFVMLRKRGKLPGAVIGLDYALEYGSDRIEIQADAIKPGARVVILDDLLATGGTMQAGVSLLRNVGAEVPAAAALIELSFLGGRQRVDVPCLSLVAYES